MPGSDLQITISADASGLKSGVDAAKSAIDDFAPKIEALGKSASELGAQFKEGFDGAANPVKRHNQGSRCEADQVQA